MASGGGAPRRCLAPWEPRRWPGPRICCCSAPRRPTASTMRASTARRRRRLGPSTRPSWIACGPRPRRRRCARAATRAGSSTCRRLPGRTRASGGTTRWARATPGPRWTRSRLARYVLVRPLTWMGHMSMRAAVLTCADAAATAAAREDPWQRREALIRGHPITQLN
ncbi:unnamed protein product [Prorocentrum cordatum]|uniref:Uncharacterized protein n=2 Tax=Prorocentrum cordatum TaxID=2364126 RepID=A0ABN9SDZ1_9DINO|nr:unnamed protein product [Polarella glacialis]